MFFPPETASLSNEHAEFSPETADFCIDIPEDGSESSSSLGDGINEMEDPHKLDPENKPKHLKQHRGFLDVMDTMNIKFGYNDGKLSASLDLISLYLKGQKLNILYVNKNKKIDDILEYRKTRITCDSDVKAELYNDHHNESSWFFY